MIHHIEGTLSLREPSRAVIDAGGVGYELTIPLSTGNHLPALGSKCRLLVHLLFRQDDVNLYGFATETERGIFRTLISVSGIGPSLAVRILSGADPAQFAAAVEKQDVDFFKGIKGIGEKTAKRLLLELKGASFLIEPSAASGSGGVGAAGSAGADALKALVQLGLPQKEARDRVEKALAVKADSSVEELLRAALA